MRCLVTGIHTTNKWKSKPIHKAVLRKASLMTGTTRENLIKMKENFNRLLPNKGSITTEEYEELVIEFLKINN